MKLYRLLPIFLMTFGFLSLQAAEVYSVKDLLNQGKVAIDEDGKLDLSGQNFTSAEGLQDISATEKKKVKYLNLARNNLSSLPEGIFKGFDNLEYLRLNDNQLDNFPLGVSQDLKNVQYLFLTNNNLTTLPEGTLNTLSRLKSFSLIRNPLITDEEMERIEQEAHEIYLDTNKDIKLYF